MAYDVHGHHQKWNELLINDTPFALVTLVDSRGSIPQIQGAKAIITSSGIVHGTLGGGKVEAKAIAHAQNMIEQNDGLACELVNWNLQTDIAMTCGGEVKFFFEVHLRHDWKITLFGAGHVVQALIPILLSLNCFITCIDQRPAWLDRLPTHTRLKKINNPDLKSEVKAIDPKSFVAIMTQGHATDLPILAEILRTHAFPYVGVIGSIQKAKILRTNLKELGISEELIDSFFCPIGLPLGTNTPAEISISIVAQLIQERDRLKILKHKTKAF